MKKLILALLCITGQLICSAQNATLIPLLEFDNAAITSISENGEWACGSAFNNNDNAGYQSNASIWNLRTGERTYLISDDEMDKREEEEKRRKQEQRNCGNRARCKCGNVLLCVCGNARKLLERN